jgi:hypothetical protein
MYRVRTMRSVVKPIGLGFVPSPSGSHPDGPAVAGVPSSAPLPPSAVVHHFDLPRVAVLADEADSILILGLRNLYLPELARVIMCGD